MLAASVNLFLASRISLLSSGEVFCISLWALSISLRIAFLILSFSILSLSLSLALASFIFSFSKSTSPLKLFFALSIAASLLEATLVLNSSEGVAPSVVPEATETKLGSRFAVNSKQDTTYNRVLQAIINN